ncbi:hypothetical protein RRG08_049208 [Elysia crispata]|uniref:Uncharacterized protein n=1 Tax=Elysia crispata TaxID=231223 RepID=A0AAE0YAU6_9GAST|nr:hypothetical protein RRG08_049208 [Elysia crispata]
MAAYSWSRQSKHHVTILCKLKGLNLLPMLLILATRYNECVGFWFWGEFPWPPSKSIPTKGLLELCPLQGYAVGENSFTVQLFEPLYFEVCFYSLLGMPPRVLGVRAEAGNDSRTSGTFQTSVTKNTKYLFRYSVNVKAKVIQPYDLVLWKMSVVDWTDKDGHNPLIFSFRVNAQGPPQCPQEVAAINKFNAHTINSSECEENTVGARTFAKRQEVDTKKPTKTSENSYSKISKLHIIIIGASFLAGIIPIILVIITFICRKRDRSGSPREFETLTKNSVYGLTRNHDAQKRDFKSQNAEETSDDRKGAERQSHNQGDCSGRLRESDTLIINTVYGLVRDEAGNSDAPNRDFESQNAEETSDDWKGIERQSHDQGDGSRRLRESETLIINTVYGLVRDVAGNSYAPNRGTTSYVNQNSLISMSTDHSETDGIGNGSINKRPFLKKSAPRQQLYPPMEGTEYTDLGFPTTNA